MGLMNAPATPRLTPDEVTKLVAQAQDVTSTLVRDEDGSVRWITDRTPAATEALMSLVTAFQPAISNAARRGARASYKVVTMSREDAYGVAVVEFIAAVDAHDVEAEAEGGIPFTAKIRTLLHRKVGDALVAADTVRIAKSASRLYWHYMFANGNDYRAAYRYVVEHKTGIAPATFVAIHEARAIGTLEIGGSLASGQAQPGSVGGSDDIVTVRAGQTPDLQPWQEEPRDFAEDIATNDLVHRTLLPALDAKRQRPVTTLAYGFPQRLATETVLVGLGLRPGEALPDAAVGEVLGLGRVTVQRARTASLDVMRPLAQSAERGEPITYRTTAETH